VTGPAETARHLADVEHDLAVTIAELADYRTSLDLVHGAVAEAWIARSLPGTDASVILDRLIDKITAAAPAPADPNRSTQ
jgi:hypothetical protein